MAQVVAATSIFNPGQDLWIVPGRFPHSWVNILDWYLNFQLLRAEHHQTRPHDEATLAILEETGLPKALAQLPTEKDPVLVPGHPLVPTKWLMYIPMTSLNDKTWVSTFVDKWSSLQKPPVKIFLPPSWSAQSFLDCIPNRLPTENFALVLDQDKIMQ